MTAPLSRFLTRFSAPADAVAEAAPDTASPAVEPLIMLTSDELGARLDAARHEAVASLEMSHGAEVAALMQAHAAAMSEALTAARAEWCEAEAARLVASIDAATAALRDLVSERTAAVLRPWLADAITARVKQGLGEAFGRLLTDAKSPNLRVCGPADLVDAMREVRPDASIEWSIAEAVDVTVVGDATRIETRLAAALAELTES